MIPEPFKCLGKGRLLCEGAFRPNGNGAIDNTLNKGVGFTVARTNVGIYTVTLTDPYIDLVSHWLGLRLNALASVWLQLGAVDVSSAKTIVINAYQPTAAGNTAAAAFDIASHANNWIDFGLILRKSTVGP